MMLILFAKLRTRIQTQNKKTNNKPERKCKILFILGRKLFGKDLPKNVVGKRCLYIYLFVTDGMFKLNMPGVK